MAEAGSAIRQWGWRLAAGAFIAYGVYAGIAFQPTDADEWIHRLLRSLLASGIVLGLSWILLAILGFLWRSASALRVLRWHDITRERPQSEETDAGRRQWEQEKRRRLEEEVERESRQLEHSRQQAEAQRRRTNAKARASLTFGLFAPKIQSRFTQQMFDDFLSKYLGDDQTPDDVERRVEELTQTFQRHLEEIEPPEGKRSIEELGQWFLDQKRRIEELPLDPKVKRAHVADLNSRYAEISTKLLEKLHP